VSRSFSGGVSFNESSLARYVGRPSMKPIKLPFGFNENKILVHIADVERGRNCKCVCPGCGSSLIANKGSKNQPHFKHAVDNKCKGESAIHLAAKQIIRERKRITLPGYNIVRSAVKDSRGEMHRIEPKIVVKNGEIINFDSVQEEMVLHGMKADILAQKGNTPLIIEIFYRHKVEDQKRLKIFEANISAIEIDLSGLTPEDIKNWETFWLYINDVNRIRWLHNTKAQRYGLELEKKLENKILEQEEKYRQEEIKKQKMEQRGKEQLLPSLKELKILSSEESIAQLKQQAEAHPFWRDNARHLSFSFNNLPDFVNVDVPDGDWIFGCDRRIWQTAFYNYFVLRRKDKPFRIKYVDDWLQGTIGFKVRQSVKIVGIYGRRNPQLVPDNIYNNLPSTWKTLRAYFIYLEKLGMVEFSIDIYTCRRNDWLRVINKKPVA